MISYEEFVVSEATLIKYKKAWAKINIAKYIKAHGTEPPLSMAESFYQIPSYAMEKLKRDEYARYYEKFDGLYDDKQIITPPDNPTPEPEPYLSISSKISKIESGANGSMFIIVESNTYWSLETDVDWVTLSRYSGEGGCKTIILSYENAKVDFNIIGHARNDITAILQITVVEEPPIDIDDEHYNPQNFDWLELPLMDNDELIYKCHYFNLNGREQHNYSYGFSPKDRIPMWAAYPLNKNLRGNGSRAFNWGYDPLLPSDIQQNITMAYGRDNDGNWYYRGHLVPSADRLVSNANSQIWYFTNFTPQSSQVNEQ